MDDVGRVIAGRYRLLEVLGRGGMATVYCAVDRVACRAAAVKLIHGDRLGHSVLHTRFHREARIIAELQSDGFARLYDWGIERGTPFMVMEMVEGESLREVLRRHRRLELAPSLRIAIAVCARLEHVHAHGLVHRDIKPGNVMVQSLEDARLKIIDFGIAKHLERRDLASLGQTHPLALTVEGMVLGSPPYTAPEQLRSESVDARADLYAVGMLLYRMVTGETPFAAAHSLATACMQLSRRPKPPSAVFPVPVAVEEVIMRCLEPSPRYRYATAHDLRAALTSALEEVEAETSEEEPVTLPLERWARVGSGAAVFAAAVLAGATSAALLLG